MGKTKTVKTRPQIQRVPKIWGLEGLGLWGEAIQGLARNFKANGGVIKRV